MKTVAISAAVIAASVFGLAYLGYKLENNTAAVKKLQEELAKSKEALQFQVSVSSNIEQMYEEDIKFYQQKLKLMGLS